MIHAAGPSTLAEIIQTAAQESPDDLAVLWNELSWTFSELWQRICGVGALFGDIEPQHVGVLSENSADFVTLLYALPQFGYSVVPINTRHNATDVQAQLDHYDIRVLLVSPRQLDRIGPDLALHQLDTIMTLHGDHELANTNLSRELDALSNADLVENTPSSTPAECAWIINTSGTTGVPKGVMLSHANIVAAVATTARGRPVANDDVYLFPFPLFHVAAYNVINVHAHRRPVVLMDKFDAQGFIDLLLRHGVTNCSLAPTMLQMLLAQGHTAISTMSQLRQVSYGASSMPLALLHDMATLLPDVGLAQGYGMTELGGNAVFLSPEDHRSGLYDRPELLRAAGRAPDTVEICVANEFGEALPHGESGEILIAGPQVCMGYFNDGNATSQSRHNKWFRTGDVGMLDEQGYLFIVDRIKDIIITGGENVASREVEDALSVHPLVANVAVIGIADAQWGELVTAVVVRACAVEETVTQPLDEAILMAWAKERISSFKQPRRIHFVDELPVNASGKVDKVLLRQRFS